MMQAIQNDVRRFVAENFLFAAHADDLSDTESLLERGIIDSTGVLELVGFLERRYGITIEDHELVPANLDSVERIVRFVQSKRKTRVTDIAS